MVTHQENLLNEFLSLSEKFRWLETDHRFLRNQIELALHLIRDAWPEPSEAKHLVIDKVVQALEDTQRPFER
jgi:hypothetical protein